MGRYLESTEAREALHSRDFVNCDGYSLITCQLCGCVIDLQYAVAHRHKCNRYDGRLGVKK